MRNLFRKMQSSGHCVHTLLPPDRPLSDTLRSRDHDFGLPRCSLNLHKQAFVTVCLNLLKCELAFIYVFIATCNLSAYMFVMCKIKDNYLFTYLGCKVVAARSYRSVNKSAAISDSSLRSARSLAWPLCLTACVGVLRWFIARQAKYVYVQAYPDEQLYIVWVELQVDFAIAVVNCRPTATLPVCSTACGMYSFMQVVLRFVICWRSYA